MEEKVGSFVADGKGNTRPNPDDEATAERLNLKKGKRKEAGDVPEK